MLAKLIMVKIVSSEKEDIPLLSFRNVAEAQIWKSKYSTEAVARIEVANLVINVLMSRKRIFDLTSNVSLHL